MHIRKDHLTDYALGLLGEAEARDIADHLAQCPQCDEEMTRLDSAADTVVAGLRTRTTPDPHADEAGCQEMMSAIKAIGWQAAAADGASATPGEWTSIREYRLLAKIGEGGMGTVYRAVHTRLGKTVAVKVMAPGRLREPAAVQRFQREMLAVGRLDHPNIVQATDAGEHEGTPFLVMEYVEGSDLSRLVKRAGRLNPDDACEIIRQAALALQEAHDRGLVHRDIKPSNLMLAADRGPGSAPMVKLLDLGVALLHDGAQGQRELTADGQIVGTYEYMAPEQIANSRDVDIRADIFALGMTFLKLLCGETPVLQQRRHAVMSRAAVDDAASRLMATGDVPARLKPIIGRMVAVRPEDRYSAPRQVAEALMPLTSDADLPGLLLGDEHPTNDRPTESLCVERARPIGSRRRQRRWILIGAGICAVAVVAAVSLIPPETAPPGDLDRDVAQWMLEGGNQIAVFSESKYAEITSFGELPAKPYRIRTARFSRSKPTDEQWASLAQLEELSTLSLFTDPRINNFLLDDRDAEQIANCQGLTSLLLDGTLAQGHHEISDRGLEQLSRIEGLRSLIVNSSQVGDSGLAHLARLSNLQQLGLRLASTADITAEGMRRLAAMPQLNNLTVSTSAMNDEVLEPLANSRSLVLLRLLFSQVTGRGLAALEPCGSLRRLELHHSQVTRAELEAMAQLRQLTRIELVAVEGIDDGDLLALTPLTNLQVVVFFRCPQLTDAGLDALRQALPACYVGREQPPAG